MKHWHCQMPYVNIGIYYINLEDAFNGIDKQIMKWNKIYDYGTAQSKTMLFIEKCIFKYEVNFWGD